MGTLTTPLPPSAREEDRRPLPVLRTKGGSVVTASALDLYDIAFLAGGPDRVVDTALVALVRHRRIRVHSPGQLATVDLTRRHPVEAAVLDAVGPTGHRSVDTVRWRLTDDDRLVDIGRRLRRAGLLRRTGVVLPLLRPARRAPTATRAGRTALRELRLRGAPDEAMRVALEGPAGMVDQKLRAAVFERPSTTLSAPGSRRRSGDIDHSDPRLAAYRTGGAAAAAGGFALFGGEGGGL